MGSWTILATIGFSKVFNSVWYPARYHKLILVSLPPALLVGLNLFFVIVTWFFKITRVALFKTVKVFCKDLFLALYFSLFLLIIFLLLLSAAYFMLTTYPICSSFPFVHASVGATQGALIRLECWSEYWCFPINLSKCEAYSQRIPIKLISSFTSSYSTFPSTLISLQLFLGSSSIELFIFLSMYLHWRTSFLVISRPCAASLFPQKAHLRSPLSCFSSAPSYLCFTWIASFS